MTIDSLKQLEQLIKLCRKQGITKVSISGIELELGTLPIKVANKAANAHYIDPMADMAIPQPNIQDPLAYAKDAAAKALKNIQDYIKTDEPTEDQMLHWSSRQEAGHETQ